MSTPPPNPTLRKQSISQYFTTECDRQLALELWRSFAELQQMPPRQVPRAGIEIMTREGLEWERLKVDELAKAFTDRALVGNPEYNDSGEVSRWQAIPLDSALGDAQPGDFLVEAEFGIGASFVAAHQPGASGNGLRYADLRPDLIQVLSPHDFQQVVTPAGKVVAKESNEERWGLRVIDIKLTAEPSRGHFAEVVYYACALAGWLNDNGLCERFIVVDSVALWPGSHEGSAVMAALREANDQDGELTNGERFAALEEDLEEVPFEVVALRLQRFFESDLPRVLGQPWQDLNWHVDGRCRHCDWLGQKWHRQDGTQTWHDDHCIPTAEDTDHLSRVAFMPRGAAVSLRERNVNTVTDLAGLDSTSSEFDDHQSLRINRGVLAGRAESLKTAQSGVPQGAGTSAVMPRWADLRVRISVDFDAGSGISVAFAAEANWVQPFGSRQGEPERYTYRFQHFTVQERSLEAERERLTAFLGFIHEILADAHTRDPDSSYQVYIWDRVQYEHLIRVIGRHLPSLIGDQRLRNLVWLFPPEEIAANPSLHTRNSPITIVRDVVRAVVGAPIPHYYSLLSLARVYRPSWPDDQPQFSVHPLLEDPLSDQIPSERAHEIWSRATKRFDPRSNQSTGRDWQEVHAQLVEALRVRLRAIQFVVRRLTEDLGNALTSKAPPIRLERLPPDYQSSVSFDGQLWYAFARLDSALDALEVHQHRARPVHEREARFVAARLPRRLLGAEATDALAVLGLTPLERRRVYELAEGSCELRARVGDFDWSLAPEGDPHFLDRSISAVAREHGLDDLVHGYLQRLCMDEVTAVSIAGLDRDARLIAVDMTDFALVAPLFDELHEAGALDLEEEVVLDGRHTDSFTSRLLGTLRAIGNPRVAADNANREVRSAMGMEGRRGARRSPDSPVADVLWEPRDLVSADGQLDPSEVLSALSEAELELNESQRRAIQNACSRRLSLVWGPPGTGKSRTLRGLIVGASLAAGADSLRVLICGPTYTSVDNVLHPVRDDLAHTSNDVLFARVRSASRPGEGTEPELDYPLDRREPDQKMLDLHDRLLNRVGTTIVAATAQQVHNLLAMDEGRSVGSLFDLIVIDEASQLDVGHAVLALASLAEQGTVVVAGDHLQLPPIHKATAPVGLETMVGSIYSYFSEYHGIGQEMLETNYRSNDVIVDFVKTAGYRTELTAHYPRLRLGSDSTLQSKPQDWPAAVTWSPGLAALTDPDSPISCFVYPEGKSSQWNHFEAEVTAALVRLFWQSPASVAVDPDSPGNGSLPDAEHFFGQTIGIVTPHRAQQSLVITQIQKAFGDSPPVTHDLIRGSVDTVERFQGQERDIIIATFALGDPDSIGNEEEFLLSLNRFNVMASRARAKLIVLVSDEVSMHLARDPEVIRGSALLKRLVSTYCDHIVELEIGYGSATGQTQSMQGRCMKKGW